MILHRFASHLWFRFGTFNHAFSQLATRQELRFDSSTYLNEKGRLQWTPLISRSKLADVAASFVCSPAGGQSCDRRPTGDLRIKVAVAVPTEEIVTFVNRRERSSEVLCIFIVPALELDS